MFKVIALIKKRAGLSAVEFRERYEREHVPLVMSSGARILRYVRNYVAPDDSERVGYDCITEVWLVARADFDAFLGLRDGESPAGAALRRNIQDTFERENLRLFAVSEVETSIESTPETA